MEKLGESNKTKEALLYKIRAVDRNREKAAKELAIAIGADSTQPRLLDLARKLKGPQGQALQDWHKTLSLQIERVIEFNQENEQYAKSALTALNGAMNEIKQTVTVKPTYGEKKAPWLEAVKPMLAISACVSKGKRRD